MKQGQLQSRYGCNRPCLVIFPKNVSWFKHQQFPNFTTVPKFGKKFEDASILFDHSDHTGHPYVNGHCFVSLTICVPVMSSLHGIPRIHYISSSAGYVMWRKDETDKLEIAANLVDDVMPELAGRQVILSFDS